MSLQKITFLIYPLFGLALMAQAPFAHAYLTDAEFYQLSPYYPSPATTTVVPNTGTTNNVPAVTTTVSATASASASVSVTSGGPRQGGASVSTSPSNPSYSANTYPVYGSSYSYPSYSNSYSLGVGSGSNSGYNPYYPAPTTSYYRETALAPISISSPVLPTYTSNYTPSYSSYGSYGSSPSYSIRENVATPSYGVVSPTGGYVYPTPPAYPSYSSAITTSATPSYQVVSPSGSPLSSTSGYREGVVTPSYQVVGYNGSYTPSSSSASYLPAYTSYSLLDYAPQSSYSTWDGGSSSYDLFGGWDDYGSGGYGWGF